MGTRSQLGRRFLAMAVLAFVIAIGIIVPSHSFSVCMEHIRLRQHGLRPSFQQRALTAARCRPSHDEAVEPGFSNNLLPGLAAVATCVATMSPAHASGQPVLQSMLEALPKREVVNKPSIAENMLKQLPPGSPSPAKKSILSNMGSSVLSSSASPTLLKN